MPDGVVQKQLHPIPEARDAPDMHLVFPASDEAVRCALASVMHVLGALEVDALTLGTAEIVLAEVANNIVEHAYATVTDGTITLFCRKEEDYVCFELSDHGSPLPGLKLPAKQDHDLSAELNALPEGGFGWGLIRDMTHTLSYRRSGERNFLRFSIRAQDG